ncbi:MAG TPA: hypothetical protein VHZ03_23930 [Trebonia sp.]|jgi:hypothetical protein|nr:hypothetical protein [Trebonia sp.]
MSAVSARVKHARPLMPASTAASLAFCNSSNGYRPEYFGDGALVP